MFNTPSLVCTAGSPICWRGARYGTQVPSRPLSVNRTGWWDGHKTANRRAVMTICHFLAAQHLTPFLLWGSLQCVGFDGKPSPTSYCKSQGRRPQTPSSYPWQMEHAQVSEAWPNRSFYKKT